MFAIAGSHLPIIGGTPAEATLSELVAFSEKKENWFNNPEESAEAAKTRTDQRPEGGHHATNTRHITVKDAFGDEETYHISFTITQGQVAKADLTDIRDVLLRHATIGVGDLSRVVDATEAFTILKFLGFKEIPRMMEHPDFPALVFLDVLTPEEEEALRRQAA